MSSQRATPPALVIKWSTSSVRVKCPDCLEAHNHAPGLSPRSTQYRQSDCPNGGSYRLLYPPTTHEGTSIGWELEREEGVLYAMTAEGRIRDPKDEYLPRRRLLEEEEDTESSSSSSRSSTSDLNDAMAGATLSDDEAELPRAPEPPDHEQWHREYEASEEGRANLFISHCSLGELASIHRLLHRYSDHDFRSIKDDEGHSAAHCAVFSEHRSEETLKLLRTHNFELDLHNKYGRTPLMEAALWAREDAVRYLIENGADIRRGDANNMCAIDFAKESKRNEHERSERAGIVYRPLASADATRRRILGFLQRQAGTPSPTTDSYSTSNDPAGLFRRNGVNNWTFYHPVTLYELPTGQAQKAVAVLNRGSAYPAVSAMSGYSQENWRNVLDNAKWTTKAQELCALVGHQTSRSFASHVEKQLIAYYLDHHLHLAEAMEEPADPPRRLASVGQAGQAGQASQTSPNLERLPWDPETPGRQITINKPKLCWDCEAFVKCLESRFGLSFVFTVTKDA